MPPARRCHGPHHHRATYPYQWYSGCRNSVCCGARKGLVYRMRTTYGSKLYVTTLRRKSGTCPAVTSNNYSRTVCENGCMKHTCGKKSGGGMTTCQLLCYSTLCNHDRSEWKGSGNGHQHHKYVADRGTRPVPSADISCGDPVLDAVLLVTTPFPKGPDKPTHWLSLFLAREGSSVT